MTKCLLCFLFGHKNDYYTLTQESGKEIEIMICVRCHSSEPNVKISGVDKK